MNVRLCFSRVFLAFLFTVLCEHQAGLLSNFADEATVKVFLLYLLMKYASEWMIYSDQMWVLPDRCSLSCS